MNVLLIHSDSHRYDCLALSADIAGFKHDLWETMKTTGDRLASIWTRMELQGSPSIVGALGMEK